MKYTKSLLCFAIATLTVVSCKKEDPKSLIAATEQTKPKAKKEIASANLQTASFTVEGMTCAVGCAKTIQEELSNLNGVQIATVDFEKKLATVSFDKTAQTPENLTKVVQATGDGATYKVSNMK